MAKIRLIKAQTSVTKRNVKYYLTAAIPYVSLVISLISLLKVYGVIF